MVLDLISIGKKLRIKSFMSLEEMDSEITTERKEQIFKVIFKCESIRVMKLVLSKKLRANENYQMNLMRMEVCAEEDADFDLYKYAYDAHNDRS